MYAGWYWLRSRKSKTNIFFFPIFLFCAVVKNEDNNNYLYLVCVCDSFYCLFNRHFISRLCGTNYHITEVLHTRPSLYMMIGLEKNVLAACFICNLFVCFVVVVFVVVFCVLFFVCFCFCFYHFILFCLFVFFVCLFVFLFVCLVSPLFILLIVLCLWPIQVGGLLTNIIRCS